MKKFSLLTASLLLSATFFSGCGSSDSTDTTTALTSGQLVDSFLSDVDYECADGTSGLTDSNGSFQCQELPVTFKLGGLKLATINTIPADTLVFPQDLLGVARTDVNNTDVLAMARFLQSCDDDNNSQNGIKIQERIRIQLADTNDTFSAAELDQYATDLQLDLVDEITATDHLESTTTFADTLATLNLPADLKTALLTPNATLTQDLKNTLSYMGNEERLAFDVYNYLYEYHLTNSNTAVKQLTNIATKSESTHIQTVRMLIQKYITDLSEFTNIDATELNYKYTAIEDMEAGVYDISAIQTLYNELTIKGMQSVQGALEVGCIVEVTDVNDLLLDIEIAKDANATDIVTGFEFLLNGSYNHYWAFDKGLKNMGIAEGCASLGSEYSHPEYPQNTNGH